MILNKITVGWVTQRYDADKNRFISQDFFAGDQVDFEKLDGTVVKQNISQLMTKRYIIRLIWYNLKQYM